LHPLAIVFLFLLMLLNSANIDWLKFKNILKNPLKIIFANFILFVVSPLIIFLFAKSLLDDNQYIYGAVFSALTPAAIVAPFFTRILKGNKELSYSILLSSMIISPLVIPLMLKIFVGSLIPVSAMLLFKDILLIVPLPLVIGFLIWKYLPKLNTKISNNGAILNFVFLGTLIFILFGVSFNKFNFNHTNNILLTKLLFLAFVQDFAIIILWGFIANKFKNKEDSIALVLSISMKNIAIAGGILLLHDPKAALAPAIGFIAHAFLFTPFIIKKLINDLNKSNSHPNNPNVI